MRPRVLPFDIRQFGILRFGGFSGYLLQFKEILNHGPQNAEQADAEVKCGTQQEEHSEQSNQSPELSGCAGTADIKLRASAKMSASTKMG